MQQTTKEVTKARRDAYKAKRAAYKAELVGRSRVLAERVQTASRAADFRSYGNAVRDISRDASRRGVISNKPLTARAPVQVRTANTSSVGYREQSGANVVIRHVLPDTRF